MFPGEQIFGSVLLVAGSPSIFLGGSFINAIEPIGGIVNFLSETFDKLQYFLKKYDVVIAATGVAGLIKGEMVDDGFIGIDLGYTNGDFSHDAFEKALMIPPVPGGVGPLTIVSLFESLSSIDQ